MDSLKDRTNIEVFISQTINLYKEWNTLTSTERGVKLLSGINTNFKNLKIPQIKVYLKPISALGQLQFSNWSIELKQSILEGSKEAVDFADVCDTIYHESRHAEQWYRCAEFLAAEKVSNEPYRTRKSAIQNMTVAKHARLIADILGMDWNICKIAIDTSRTSQYQMVDTFMIKGWFESIYGRRSHHRDQTYQNMDDTDITVSSQAEKDYLNLPEERDAHAVGDNAKAAWNRKWASLNVVRQRTYASAPMTFKDWKSKTSLLYHNRSPYLKDVDNALEAYEQQPNGLAFADLKKAFGVWFTKDRADYTRRNYNKTAEALKAFVA